MVVSQSVGRGLVRAATLKKLPRIRVNANGRMLLRVTAHLIHERLHLRLIASRKYGIIDGI